MTISVASFILFVFALLFGYLIGSVNFSIIFSKYKFKVDIRTQGSKNPGATNTFRVLGKKAGLLVLLLDVLKGIIPVLLCWFIYFFWLKNYLTNIYLNFNFGTIIYLAGFFAVVGHIFPAFFKFKGGKGVATTFGLFLTISPFITIIGILLMLLIVKTKKMVSFGSIITIIVLPFLVLIPYLNYLYLIFPNILELKNHLSAYMLNSLFVFAITFFVALMVVLKHKDNILRIKAKQENKIGAKKR